MRSFVHNSHPGRVIFGAGTLTTALPGEVERLGCERLLILSTPGHEALAQTIAERLGVGKRNVFAGARMHTPVAVTDRHARIRSARLISVNGRWAAPAPTGWHPAAP